MASAGSDLTNAFGNFLPRIDFNMGYNRQLDVKEEPITVESPPGSGVFNTVIPSANSYSMRVGANLTVFDGFNRESNYNRAKARFASADLNSQYARSDALYSVRNQFINVLRNKEIVNTRREDLDLGEKELDRIRIQYEVGKLPLANVYAQEAELGNKELLLVQAQNDLDIAKSMLIASMGLDPSENAEFIDSDTPDTVNQKDIDAFRKQVGTYKTALQKSMNRRKDYSSIEKQNDAAASSVSIARSNYFPAITANAGWDWSNSEFNNFSSGRPSIGLNLAWPIFNNFSRSRQVQDAEVEKQRLDIELQRLQHAIATDLQRAFLQLSAAEKELEITSRTLRSAELNFANANERFNVGAGTLLDYQTANNQLINARINRIGAVYKYLQAQYLVEFTIGDLD